MKKTKKSASLLGSHFWKKVTNINEETITVWSYRRGSYAPILVMFDFSGQPDDSGYANIHFWDVQAGGGWKILAENVAYRKDRKEVRKVVQRLSKFLAC